MSLSLAELTRLLPPQAPPPPAIPTGIAALDAVLLGGGLPRGRLTELLGPTGSGKTTLVRAIVEQTVSSRGWVAYIDAQRTLDPRDWTHLGDAQGVWMIRPHDASRAPWCADVLLRSGAFTLVVLDGAPLLSKSNAVRLTRLARDGNCALVVLGDRVGGATQLGGAVRLLLERPRHRGKREEEGEKMSSRTIAVRVEKGGTLRTVEVSCAVPVARRLCTHPEVPDRRGVARGPAGGSPRHARSSPRTECRGAGGAGSPAAVATQPAGGAAAGVVPRQLHTAVTRARALG
jgi:recombination protein RecA